MSTYYHRLPVEKMLPSACCSIHYVLVWSFLELLIDFNRSKRTRTHWSPCNMHDFITYIHSHHLIQYTYLCVHACSWCCVHVVAVPVAGVCLLLFVRLALLAKGLRCPATQQPHTHTHAHTSPKTLHTCKWIINISMSALILYIWARYWNPMIMNET